ncbi:MAG: succinate dehydrogenase assembly factor 2 [Pseudomonadota bacterium]
MSDSRPAPAGATDERRLKWRSRRGMLELELALAPFVEHRLAGLGERERRTYLRLLEHDDWDIYEWIQGESEPADPELATLVAGIRDALGR